MSDKVKDMLDDFNVTLEFSVKDLNIIINLLAQLPYIQAAPAVHEMQRQAAPQVEKAKASLEAIEKAKKDET